MTVDEYVTYCLSKPGVEESFPFDDQVLVMKVMGKVFALANITVFPLKINLKCDPERAIELRDEHEEVQPGYHMSKKHWNTVLVEEGTLEQSLILELIDHSYDLVVSKLTKKQKETLAQLKADQA